MMKNVSLIIPIYNEEQNILQLYNEIKKSEAYTYLNEIIYINDKSTDSSEKIINKLILKDKKIRIINNIQNLGQSHSIYKGIKSSKNEIVATIDGDGQNDPKDLIKLILKYFQSDNKLIGGIRTKRKDKLIKIISSLIANKIRKFILNDDCDDTGCSLKVFNKKIFLKFDFFNGLHRFLPALFKAFGHKCYFMTVNHRSRKFGNSNYGTFDRLFVGIYHIIRVKKIINKLK